ncbi:MAG: rod shape-determining protein [Actinomycetota bacterium]|nr:rod shape-determining protein [Actinomycetota bacterium]
MDGVSIDLGTANTVVWHTETGMLLDEPTVMALRLDGGRRPTFVGLGREAEALVGRAPDDLEVIRPLEDGVITDLETTRRFLRQVLHQVAPGWWQRRRLSAVIGVPIGATALQRRALLEAAEEAGMGHAQLVPEPVAGAVGCGIDPLEPRTHMVVDVGGGTSEVAAFGSGGVLAYRSCPLAGAEMTVAVYQYLRNEHQLVVGELVAEEVKVRASREPGPSLTVEGQDAATGRPRVVNLALEEIAEAVTPVVDEITQTLSSCLEDLPPQSVSDVMAEGVIAVGGGCLLPGFDKCLEDAFGFTPLLAERPLTCVAEGAARCLEQPEILTAYAVH